MILYNAGGGHDNCLQRVVISADEGYINQKIEGKWAIGRQGSFNDSLHAKNPGCTTGPFQFLTFDSNDGVIYECPYQL